MFFSPGCDAKSSISLFIRKPRPGATRALPKESLSVVVIETTIPAPSTTEKCVVVGFSGKTRGEVGRRRGAIRIDGSHEALRAGRIDEELLVDAGERRVPQELVAVAERALLDLGEPVHRRRSLDPQAVGDQGDGQRHLGEDRSRGRRGRREDLGPQEREAQGGADLRLVAAEVAARDQAARRLLAVLDVARDLAPVEAVLAAVADRGERLREIRLTEDRSHDGRRAVGQEDARGAGILRQPRAVGGDRLGDVLGHRETVARELDGRLEEDLPGEPPARRCASARPATEPGTPDARAPWWRRPRQLPGCATNMSRARRAGRHLPEVHGQQAALRVAGNPEPAASDVAGLRPRHGQGEGHGHGCVRSVAALAEDLDADPGGVPSSAATAPPEPSEARGRSAAGSAAEAKTRSSAPSRRITALFYRADEIHKRTVPRRVEKSSCGSTSTCRSTAGRVADDTRIAETLPTLRLALEAGRAGALRVPPRQAEGQAQAELSLAPVAARLAELLGKPVRFVEDCVGPEAAKAAEALAPGEVLLLENLRFHAGEEANDPEFAAAARGARRRLRGRRVRRRAPGARLGRRRAAAPRGKGRGPPDREGGRASSRACSIPRGRSPRSSAAPRSRERSTRCASLARRADVLLVGGGMANHFVRALGLPVGKSLLEEDKVVARARDPRPLQGSGQDDRPAVGLRRRENPDDGGNAKTVGINKIPDGLMALDIGPRTLEQFERLLGPAKTIFWNGPMGVFEKPPFDKGTMAVAPHRRRVVGRHGRRRRRERAGRARGGRRREVHARFDGRRSVARVPRRGKAARDRGARGGLIPVFASAMNLFVANWKMHKTRAPRRGRSRRSSVRASAAASRGVELALAPPWTALDAARDEKGRWALACQDVAAEAEGAFTGEVSAAMAADAGCRYAIVGHSERRRHFGEDGATLEQKLARCREAGLTPIYCIGETAAGARRGPDRGRRSGRQIASAREGPRRRGRSSSPTSPSGRSAPGAPRRPQDCGRRVRAPRAAPAPGGAAAGPVRRLGQARERRGARGRARVDGFLIGGASLRRPLSRPSRRA